MAAQNNGSTNHLLILVGSLVKATSYLPRRVISAVHWCECLSTNNIKCLVCESASSYIIQILYGRDNITAGLIGVQRELFYYSMRKQNDGHTDLQMECGLLDVIKTKSCVQQSMPDHFSAARGLWILPIWKNVD